MKGFIGVIDNDWFAEITLLKRGWPKAKGGSHRKGMRVRPAKGTADKSSFLTKLDEPVMLKAKYAQSEGLCPDRKKLQLCFRALVVGLRPGSRNG
jgi:hypothetical protein